MERYKCREACSQFFTYTDKLITKYEGSRLISNFEHDENQVIRYQEKNLDLIGETLKLVTNAQ